ncbi:MAG: c-type cytochrome [Gammaproteobacteria bacterium]|nr:c-type cytochrome [Gammaproteobacteria bacterium]
MPISSLLAEDMEKVYYKQCATCHGNEGDGNGRAGASLMPRPTDFTAPAYLKNIDENRMKRAIRDGVAGTSMVGYGRRLDEAAATAMVDFIKTQFMGIRQSTKSANLDGKKIYEAHCAVCHGDNGNTAVWAKNGLNPPPRNFTTPQAKEELSLERMITSVTYGRPGTGMMPFRGRLSDKDIANVVDYIRTQFMGLAGNKVDAVSAEAPATDTDTVQVVEEDKHYPGRLLGDFSRGEKFYQSNCFNCHGRTGEGNGPRAFFNVPRPRNFTTTTSRKELGRERLFKSISDGRRGTVMPAWKTVLTPQQVADVAEYVYQAFIHPQKKKH